MKGDCWDLSRGGQDVRAVSGNEADRARLLRSDQSERLDSIDSLWFMIAGLERIR